MKRLIDQWLNNQTMYQIVFRGLAALTLLSIVLGSFGVLAYSGMQLLSSISLLFLWSAVFNLALAKLFKVPANMESSGITALILFFVLAPATDMASALTLVLGSAIAMGSKYLIAIKRRHIVNPAAFAAFALGVFGSGAAIWWVASNVLTPFVLVVGILIVAKVQRFPMVAAFLATSLAMIAFFGLTNGLPALSVLKEAVISWPVIFFATVMLTEPFTAPGTKKHLLAYGALVGLLFGSQFHFGPVYSTPEFALLAGNVFAFLISGREKFLLTLKEKRAVAKEIYEFVFSSHVRPRFKPGQYLEWTLPITGTPDSRGNRRYFTIASSPTESDLRIGVRIGAQASTFKHQLHAMQVGDVIAADQLSGDFILPEDPKQKLVFIAGGIGITPFRSMIKYLIDRGEQRDIVLFYAAMTPDAFAYGDIFEEAKHCIGLRVINVLSGVKNPSDVPKDWNGKVGYITAEMLKSEMPDYAERMFYLSGPNAMVHAYEKLLHSMHVRSRNIVKDYFPGF